MLLATPFTVTPICYLAHALSVGAHVAREKSHRACTAHAASKQPPQPAQQVQRHMRQQHNGATAYCHPVRRRLSNAAQPSLHAVAQCLRRQRVTVAGGGSSSTTAAALAENWHKCALH